MAEWLSKSAAATAAVAGLAGSVFYTWANSDPEGYLFDPASLEDQSVEHPVSVNIPLS